MIPDMHDGDLRGHETMGAVVEAGSDVTNLKKGDRVVVPFTIACGECFFCKGGFLSGCQRSYPNQQLARQVRHNSPAGIYGYSHTLRGHAGGQADYLRVPFADAPRADASMAASTAWGQSLIPWARWTAA